MPRRSLRSKVLRALEKEIAKRKRKDALFQLVTAGDDSESSSDGSDNTINEIQLTDPEQFLEPLIRLFLETTNCTTANKCHYHSKADYCHIFFGDEQQLSVILKVRADEMLHHDDENGDRAPSCVQLSRLKNFTPYLHQQ